MPDEKIPTGNPMDRIPIAMARVRTGHTSERSVVLMTNIPPTPNPQSGWKIKIQVVELQMLMRVVNKPNMAMDKARDFDLPIRSQIKPQKKPPNAQPIK